MWGGSDLVAVEEAHYAVGLACLVLVVGHHHYGAAILLVQAVDLTVMWIR